MKSLGALAALLFIRGPGLIVAPAADEPAFASVVADHLKKLDPKKNDASTRLAALDWIHRHCRPYSKPHPDILPPLQRCLEKDPDPRVRKEATRVLAVAAMQRKPPVCPVALVRALLDPDPDVRTGAYFGATNFKKFDPAAFPVLQRCARDENLEIRRNTAEILACYDKDEKALELVRELTRDKHFWVRDGAQFALFRATDRLEDIVPYCVRVRVELRPKVPFDPKAPEAELHERARKNLISLSSWVYLHNLTAERTDATGKLLIELARDKSPQMREGVADFLAAFARRLARLRKPKEKGDFDPIDAMKPHGAPRETREQQAQRLTKVAARLREGKVEAALRQLRDRDSAASVRAAAAEALKAFAALKGKAP